MQRHIKNLINSTPEMRKQQQLLAQTILQQSALVTSLDRSLLSSPYIPQSTLNISTAAPYLNRSVLQPKPAMDMQSISRLTRSQNKRGQNDSYRQILTSKCIPLRADSCYSVFERKQMKTEPENVQNEQRTVQIVNFK
ncbi:Hypothetical_protein [Hexamita inflata]|uniref:Hypothetical_protein n=1 Tax=Hexamita inflata TaxID=28002 RepID=A0AA86P4R0_9EUKA|nr:Hypothetical protein HINF_LOCUS19258 [Hexamita inflata]